MTVVCDFEVLRPEQGVAALLPTVDPVSLAFEAIPMLVLFELSIWLSVLMERRWERAALASDSL